MNEASAHSASTMSQAVRFMPQAGRPEVKAIAAGMNAIRDKPLTTPTMQESAVTCLKLVRPAADSGSRSRDISSNMSVSFHCAHATHVWVVGELLGGAVRNETARLKDGNLIDAGN